MAVYDLPFQETGIQAPRMELGRNIQKVGVTGLCKSATDKLAAEGQKVEVLSVYSFAFLKSIKTRNNILTQLKQRFTTANLT